MAERRRQRQGRRGRSQQEGHSGFQQVQILSLKKIHGSRGWSAGRRNQERESDVASWEQCWENSQLGSYEVNDKSGQWFSLGNPGDLPGLNVWQEILTSNQEY